ncbi:AAA family ATPase [Coleofasciculus sp.]|uniref:AAA family ATPase n=1 Tax=Coleofasciculus sp. TaxID=3100458 RepID=UPI003A26D1F9
MYINEIGMINIRSIKNLYWKISLEQCAGWHIVIGDNGSGKSTLLRAIALALFGPNNAIALRQNWNDWLNKNYNYGDNENHGEIYVHLLYDSRFDKIPGGNKSMGFHGFPVLLQLREQLSEDERNEQEKLRAMMPTSPHKVC